MGQKIRKKSRNRITLSWSVDFQDIVHCAKFFSRVWLFVILWTVAHCPWDCGSSVHGILQARILEWIAMSSSRGSPPPRDPTHISYSGRWILYPLSHLGNPSHWYLICIYSALTGGSTTLEALQSITVTPLLFPIVSAITKGHSKFKSKLCLSMSFWLG